MPSMHRQLERKAEAIAAAQEAIRETGLPTPHLDEVEAEPLATDEDKVAGICADLSEAVATLSRGFDHMTTHILAEQDTRLEKLEKVSKGSSRGSSKGSTKGSTKDTQKGSTKGSAKA